MAKRRRRRFFKQRSKPDRGWILEQGLSQLSYNAGMVTPARSEYVELVAFPDLNEANSALITQEKADWNVKRVLIDCFPIFAPVDAAARATALMEFMLVTTHDPDIIGLRTLSPLDPDSWELIPHVHQSDIIPCYTGSSLSFGSGGELRVQDSGTEVKIANFGAHFGRSALHWDLKTNFTFKELQSLRLVYGGKEQLQQGSWETGDLMVVNFYARILVQKRRM